MESTFTSYQKTVEFLASLPNIHDENSQRTLIYSAGLDSQLQQQIGFNLPPMQFFQLLVFMLKSYGTLEDGRDALEAILEAAKNYVGQDKKNYCDRLIQELHTEKKEYSPSPSTPMTRYSRSWWVKAMIFIILLPLLVFGLGIIWNASQRGIGGTRIYIDKSLQEVLSMSFAEKLLSIGETQNNILNIIRKESVPHGFVSQPMLEKILANKYSAPELYYRLEQLRFLGFIEKEEIDVRGEKLSYKYRLTSAYKKESEREE